MYVCIITTINTYRTYLRWGSWNGIIAVKELNELTLVWLEVVVVAFKFMLRVLFV